MAWYDHSHRVLRTRPRNCPDGCWLPDLLGNFAVRSRLTARNLLQRLPDAALKGGGTHIERQRGTERMLVQLRQNNGKPICEDFVIPLETGLGKIVL